MREPGGPEGLSDVFHLKPQQNRELPPFISLAFYLWFFVIIIIIIFCSLPLWGCAHACRHLNQPFSYSNECRKAPSTRVQQPSDSILGQMLEDQHFSGFNFVDW